MSSDPQFDKSAQTPAANPSAQGATPSAQGEGEQQFTPEQLRKAARVQVILYVVMAVMILAPFVVMWLRKE